MWISKRFYLSAELKASLETDDDLVFPTLPVWDRLPFAEGVSSGISPKPYKKGSVIKVLKQVKECVQWNFHSSHCWSLMVESILIICYTCALKGFRYVNYLVISSKLTKYVPNY